MADLELVEEITARAEAMKLGLAKYPVDEVKAICAELRRARQINRVVPFRALKEDGR